MTSATLRSSPFARFSIMNVCALGVLVCISGARGVACLSSGLEKYRGYTFLQAADSWLRHIMLFVPDFELQKTEIEKLQFKSPQNLPSASLNGCKQATGMQYHP